MDLPKKYVSVDVEANGPYPWRSSMLSLGACIIGDKSKIFYREIKPITSEYEIEHFRIGAKSLAILSDYDHENFNPEEVLKILDIRGDSPKLAIPKFVEWVLENTEGYRPVMLAAPIIFDGQFINYYIDKFSAKQNPFGHSGEDVNSVFRGNVRDMSANIKELDLRADLPRHNALEDAVQQAREFYTTLVHMRQHKI